MHLSAFKMEKLLYVVLGISLCQSVISDYFGFHKVNYLCDVILLALLLFTICTGKIGLVIRNKSIEDFSIAAFALVVVIGWALNSVSLLSALWGVRNYGRFFLFYLLGKILLSDQDAENMENIFLKLFPFHIILVAFQYIVEGLNQDRLSGLFGKNAGGNGGLSLYLLIVLCIVICQCDHKKISLTKFMCYLMPIYINAALSELKFYFAASFLLIGWYFVASKDKRWALKLVLLALLAWFIGIQIMYFIFPSWTGYLSLRNFFGIVSSQKVYSTSKDIGRTAVFSKLAPIIRDWAGSDAVFFGIGLGNADYADAFPALNSAFFKAYGEMHYTWLSLGYLFVEVGYVGTIVYVAFFVLLEVKALLAYLREKSYNCFMGTFFPFVCMMTIAYNSSLRSNVAYMAYAALLWQTLSSKKKGEMPR